jgi:hypothetical protein
MREQNYFEKLERYGRSKHEIECYEDIRSMIAINEHMDDFFEDINTDCLKPEKPVHFSEL